MFLGTSYEWNYIIFVCVWLISVRIMLRSIHVVVCIKIVFFFMETSLFIVWIVQEKQSWALVKVLKIDFIQ